MKVATTVEDITKERQAGSIRNITDPRQRASKQGASIFKELTNYFRSQNFDSKRLAIEEQASELGKVRVQTPEPPPIVLGGEGSTLEERPDKKKKVIPSSNN